MSPTRPRLPVLPADQASPPAGGEPVGPAADGVSRRDFLRGASAAIAALGLSGCGVEEVLQKSFRELSPAELQDRLARAERALGARFGKPVAVSGRGPRPGVEFGYGLDLSRCVGCRRCVYACVKENNQSRANPQIHWIRVLEMEKAHGVDLSHAEQYYEADLVPRPGKFYMPVACHHCQNPPCARVCPAKATYAEPDGIVVVDYDWCIGCRCCMAACPYGARHFNWATPTLPADELNPATHYLGNRPREKGVVEKCTWCIQRVREGRYPACVEICAVGARKFGNLLDPESEIRQVMQTKRVFVFKEELRTLPRFYYFYAS